MATLVPPTSSEARLAAFAQKERLLERSLVKNVEFRSVGPSVMSGRVVDVDVDPRDPTHFYVAYASGGLWRTENNGMSFTPIFDRQHSLTIGDIAVDWTRGEVIWVGTGENNSSRSSYAGTGVYRSIDRGASWEHLGLADTHRTGRIVLHPTDPSTVWVAAAGRLYSPNPERGVFLTENGGRTWSKTLFVDDNTCAIDLVVDPADPNVLYAAMWERARRAWNFVEAGEGSGIFKSVDGGRRWTRLTTPGSGFPIGKDVGRIGLALHGGDPGVLYALLDNQSRRPEKVEEDVTLTREMLREMTREEFLAVSLEAIESYLDRNSFPASYTAKSIFEMVENGELEPIALVQYLEDANEQLFDTPVIGAEVYRSLDGGVTWERTHEDYIDDMYYSYGYYFGEIRAAPQHPDKIYILGVPILKSSDGGRSFVTINEENVHVDHHALWVNPNRPGHLVDGNDGGVNVSYDDGATWFKANTPPVGQFYAVQVDSTTPYRVYGGLQDNGVWVGPSTNEPDYSWYAEGDYPFDRLMGGDGMQVEVDTRTNETVYTGFQFGNYFRIDRREDERQSIKPEHELGARPYRFNWMTPIHLSRHQQDILYFGSNKVHRSLNQGESWEVISDDLTAGGRVGDVPYGTITTLDESPRKFGLLYAGTDDGRVHVTRDGGASWTLISDGLPPHLWVSRVEASSHEEGRVYVTLSGYRWDHFEPYAYRSDDYGATWTRIGTDLPMEPVNVLLEDASNEDVLYVGTDNGLYVSIDRGTSFMGMMGGMPFAPVHDLKLQSGARELVAGTHGRSIFIADVEHVQQLTPELLAEAVHVFELDSLRFDENWGERPNAWSDVREPEVIIPYFVEEAVGAEITVASEAGRVLAAMVDEAERGLNFATYDMSIDSTAAALLSGDDPPKPAENGAYYLVPGVYTVRVSAGAARDEALLRVLPPRERRRGSARQPEK